MTHETTQPRKASNADNIFTLVLTLLSLAVMVALLLPLSQTTLDLLWFYDTVICIIFLVDFFLNLRAAPKKSDYFIGQRGWLDLLGSIPSLGVLKYSSLLRLARLSRQARIARLPRPPSLSRKRSRPSRKSWLSCGRCWKKWAADMAQTRLCAQFHAIC